MNSNNNLLVDKTLKNYLNVVMWHKDSFKEHKLWETMYSIISEEGCEC